MKKYTKTIIDNPTYANNYYNKMVREMRNNPNSNIKYVTMWGYKFWDVKNSDKEIQIVIEYN